MELMVCAWLVREHKAESACGIIHRGGVDEQAFASKETKSPIYEAGGALINDVNMSESVCDSSVTY